MHFDALPDYIELSPEDREVLKETFDYQAERLVYEAMLAKKVMDCPDCGGKLKLKTSKNHGYFYGCENYPECDCVHGCHQDTLAPLGIPANKETRVARVRAHTTFDRLWKAPDGFMSRNQAYLWLRQAMHLFEEEAHIGRFTVAQCEELEQHYYSSTRGFLGEER